MSQAEEGEKRKYIRFEQAEGILVKLVFNSPDSGVDKTVPGLIVNESLGGCKLVVVSREVVKENQNCLVTFSDFKLTPVKARISWTKAIENNLQLVGLDYLVN